MQQVASGEIQTRISAQAYAMVRAMESGEFRKIGVNCYRRSGEQYAEVELHPYREADARAQVGNLEAVRARRDAARVSRTLAALKHAAARGENVMPAMLEAVKAYATVGEITRELAQVFGRYQEPVRF